MFGTLKLHLNRLGARHRSSLANGGEEQASRAMDFYTRMTARLANAERASIFILDPENRTVWLKTGTGVDEHGIEVSTGDSIVGRVIETGQPEMLSHVEDTPGAHLVTDKATGFLTRSVLCVPIRDPDLEETVGAIQVLNKRGEQGFSDEDLAVVTELAEQLQARVSREYLNQEIYGLSEKILTGTRRALRWTLAIATVLFMALLAVMYLWLLTPVVT